MDKGNLKILEELHSLQKEESNYKFIKDFRCQTEDEYEKFKSDNFDSFINLKMLKDKIREIEWELLSDQEKKNQINYLNDLKEKFKNDTI